MAQGCIDPPLLVRVQGSDMEIKETYPPNYDQIKEYFPNLQSHQPIFAYGKVIYNPFKVNVTPDLEYHESIHSRQQGEYPDVWWYQYFTDLNFRLEAELEAYCEQYKFALDNGVTGKLKEWIREKIALALSGDLYGNLISYGEADSKLRHYASK